MSDLSAEGHLVKAEGYAEQAGIVADRPLAHGEDLAESNSTIRSLAALASAHAHIAQALYAQQDLDLVRSWEERH